MKKGVAYGLLVLLFCLNGGCEKSYLEAECILLPAGRSQKTPDAVEIRLNDEVIEPELLYDHCGGYWYRIPADDLSGGDRLMMRYRSAEGDTALFREGPDDSGKWLEPSHYIDSDQPEFLKKAEQITAGMSGDSARARKIQIHLAAYFAFRIYDNSFKDRASTSLSLGYGTCMNVSRVFVALCRSLGIEARTIWGVVYSHEDNGIYNYHHQWAEFQDEQGFWHPVDFGYTTCTLRV